MKTVLSKIASPVSFAEMPKDYAALCLRYVPRPLHDAADYAAAGQAIEPLVGFEERLNADQADYLEAVSSFIEAHDRVRVKWPKSSPAETLKFQWNSMTCPPPTSRGFWAATAPWARNCCAASAG